MLLGAWFPDPSKGANPGLTHSSFVPNLLAKPGLLENFLLYQMVRSKAAARYLTA